MSIRPPTRDWSLLLSPGRGNGVRRPWPEYEPEAAAAVGRRWTGSSLGRLYEHAGLSAEHARRSQTVLPMAAQERAPSFRSAATRHLYVF